MTDIADQQEINRLNGEVERLRRVAVGAALECADQKTRAQVAEIERDRLKGVLGEIANTLEYAPDDEGVEALYAFVRSAIEAKQLRGSERLIRLDCLFDGNAGCACSHCEASDTIARLAAERDRLKVALAPFAAIKADDGDTFDTWHDDVVIRCEITVRDLKQARTALGEAS